MSGNKHLEISRQGTAVRWTARQGVREVRATTRQSRSSRCWGSDYPHSEETFPHSKERIEPDFADITKPKRGAW